MLQGMFKMQNPACSSVRENSGVNRMLPQAMPRVGGMVALLLLAVGSPCYAAGDPARGEALYQGCTDCHSIEQNDVGPKHGNVFGRKAGAVSDYSYSPALKNSGIVWNEETLDKWLMDPQSLVPGAKMFFTVTNARDRSDIIAFLRAQSQ
ncbi:c-type cytochrome [Methylocapsa aurea]|uniref:c-type cytochrome n=1 Tax=Methylocapsa aurea TaxID=663610 RepID=UPI001FD92599|nr:c-type cytochrome [Methylocapsa aurea]